MEQQALLWFQKDLRVQDNACLEEIFKNYQRAAAIVFKPSHLSPLQSQFHAQTVSDLRENLKRFNLSLFYVDGDPQKILAPLVQKNEIQTVFASQSYNSYDQRVLEAVELELKKDTKAQLQIIEQSTLLNQENYSALVENLPSSFTPFRKQVEENWIVKPLVPTSQKYLKELEIHLPEGTKQVKSAKEALPSAYDLYGGESAAQARLKEFLWDTRSIDTYKESRNGMLLKNDSSKFSPWLANGSLSARSIYFEIKKYENIYGSNDSTYWLIFELLWRDYFKFLSLKLGPRLFQRDGFLKKQKTWSQDKDLFDRWARGDTGVDFVDANMRELVLTGWMSNRGRQNVASYFAKQLQLDWTWGAEFFQQHLIDNDTESNWGNWQYLAGVGTDPRDRSFNIQRQADFYDPDFKYRNTWLKKSSMEA